ncbi:MAG TPA: hypothetical protein VHW66_02040 [Stellaceae bacterium]|jgi:hypothetical protein|nr:hypothetical protein [Stellaceae bacterium]
MSDAPRVTAGAAVLAGTPAIGRDWLVAVLLSLAACIYYALLLSAGSGGFFAALPHGTVFNSMALHLLDGRFDVDPASIGDEGFVRNGAVYAYFGILPALVRLPLLRSAEFAATDFTRLGCLAAVGMMALFKTLSVLTIARRATAASGFLTAALLAVLLAGGAQVQFLRPSIFQEAALWADACAAIFVWLTVCGWVGEAGFSRRLLLGMAVSAGFCLLARVSTAVGLYAALGLLGGWLAWRGRHAGRLRQTLARLALPLAVACAFAAAVGFVNYARWGNPVVFADLSRQIIALTQHPDRIARLHAYGEFNPIRLAYAFGYYFVPVWIWPDGAGGLLWSVFRDRVFDSVELPPGSLFVSEPLLFGLAVLALVRTARRRNSSSPAPVLPVLAGLAIPPLLIMAAIALAFRYRLEFYPFLELAALVGFAELASDARLGAKARGWIAAGVIVSVVAAQAMWVLTMLSPFGPAQSVVGPGGVTVFYLSEFM